MRHLFPSSILFSLRFQRTLLLAAAVLVFAGSVHAVPITIDATSLTMDNFCGFERGFEISTATASVACLDGSRVQALDLAPGDYFFVAMNFFPFVVTADGNVDYLPSFDSFVTGRGTSTLTVQGLPVLIDARQLLHSRIRLFAFRLQTSLIQSLRLLPGSMEFFHPAAHGQSSFRLLLKDDGTWDYQNYLNSALNGRGTNQLMIQGYPISFDLTPLTLPPFGVGMDFDPISTATPFVARLLPGIHVTGSGGPAFFHVTDDGLVDYDASLEGMLEGRGTTSLRINGLPLEVDARSLALPEFSLSGFQGGNEFPTNAVQTLRLTPGNNPLKFYVSGTAESPHHQFSVTFLPDGTVDYWPGYDGFLSGRGTNRLVIDGFPVTIDTTALPGNDICILDSFCLPRNALTTVRLPAGSYMLVRDGVAPGAHMPFKVGFDGNVDYLASHDATLMTGRGTPTLRVLDFPTGDEVPVAVTFSVTGDGTSNTIPSLCISQAPGSPFIDQCFPASPAATLTLPRPDFYRLFVEAPLDVHNTILFAANQGGTVDFYPAWDGFLSGRGTSTLGLNGLRVSINPQPLQVGSLQLLHLGAAAGNQVHDFLLFPGWAYSVGGGPGTHFVVTEQGTVDYLPFQEGFLAGRGSSTLTLNGLPLTVDPAGLPYANFVLGGFDKTFLTSGPSSFRQLPRPGYPFTRGGARFFWTLRNDGTFDFHGRMDNFGAGRNTSTLQLSGANVTVDATALSYPFFRVSNSPVLSTALPLATGLLHGFLTISNLDLTGSVQVRVLDSGTVGYFTSHGTFLNGEGTAALVDSGLTVQIDGRGVQGEAASFNLNGAGGFPTSEVQALRIHPGDYGFDAGSVHVSLRLRPDGTFDYAPSFDGLVSGRGTSQLMIGNTPAGTNVAVEPVDSTTGTMPASLSFETVTEAGNTSLTTSSSGPPPPTGFSLGDQPTYYEITTTAVFTGNITVCINYDETTVGDETQLRLFHLEGGTLVDRTSSLDTVNNLICATVTSLSPFAILEPVIVPDGFEEPLAALVPHGDVAPMPGHAFKQGSALPLRLQMFRTGVALTAADVAPPLIVRLARTGAPVDLATKDLDAGQANDSGLLFRFGDGQWVYNLSTAGLSTGTYTITIEMPDHRRFDGAFVLR